MTGASFQTQTELKTLEADGQTLQRLHKALFLANVCPPTHSVRSFTFLPHLVFMTSVVLSRPKRC